jgi:hypothetical protein
MNVIAGILIGIANHTLLGRIIAPFFWGIVFCMYTIILHKDRYDYYVATHDAETHRWGWKPGFAFFQIEYVTAAVTSLVFSLLAGLIYNLVKK